MKYLPVIVLIMTLAAACNQDTKKSSESENALENVMNKLDAAENGTSSDPGMPAQGMTKQAAVLEAVDAGTYTYVKLKAKDKEFWAAITARPVEIGKTYAYTVGLMMKDFESKQLGKTFDSVMFIQEFGEMPTAKIEAPASGFKQSDPHTHTKTRLHQQIEVQPAKGGETIAGIFDNLGNLGGNKVTVRGQVVKISKNIMNRNWIHIQDGTQSGEHYDLTITTAEAVSFNLGDVITFTGSLSVDKDFGAGYRYDAILENASVEKSTAL